MKQRTANFVRALLQGAAGAGLFRKLDIPGVPAEYIDSRTLDEIHVSGEFDRTCREFGFNPTEPNP